MKLKRWQKLSYLAIVAYLFLLPIAAMAGVDDDINKFVGDQNDSYWKNQPIHFYSYSSVRDTMIQIQDATIPKMQDTWTVFYLTGVGAVDSCPSKGMPIPGSYQITNPEYQKVRDPSGDGITSDALPQPEPSGVYTGGDNWQTITLCVLPDGTVSPVIWEDVTMTFFSPTDVDYDNNRIVHYGGGSTAPIIVK